MLLNIGHSITQSLLVIIYVVVSRIDSHWSLIFGRVGLNETIVGRELPRCSSWEHPRIPHRCPHGIPHNRPHGSCWSCEAAGPIWTDRRKAYGWIHHWIHSDKRIHRHRHGHRYTHRHAHVHRHLYWNGDRHRKRLKSRLLMLLNIFHQSGSSGNFLIIA